MTGLCSLAFFGIGTWRSNPLRKIDPSNALPNEVFRLWQVSDEEASQLGAPLAGVVADYLPERVLQQVASAVDPMQVLGVGYVIVAQRLEAERALIGSYREYRERQARDMVERQAHVNGAGAVPPDMDPARLAVERPDPGEA